MSNGIAIGKVSEATGVKVPTIRYYEQIGLLPAPPRTEGNRRTYDLKDTERLTFIRHSRELGFDIGEIRTLLSLQDRPDQSCQDADAIEVASGRGQGKDRQPDCAAARTRAHGRGVQPWPRRDMPRHRDFGRPREMPTPPACRLGPFSRAGKVC